ncbi:IclR family transcriptional regulator [Microbacterium allomyrinae]|uniref:Glycerol operon regulatory protein n=1 Tax=Microbacterium allomyrinae TaxID=2830666 RepID=A0A9X1LWB9_9MICO|nr:IclR family transcriptional regulator [Microbacterium allomyrinae]MCC2033249.1 IclR family transcriptional regulator [Microbacterium allomyrinae]
MAGATSDSPASAYRERNSTADRALDILGLFDDRRTTLSATDVAAAFGVARSTAYRYLQTLIAGGFVEEDPAGGFRLGLRVFELARLARRSYGLSEIALPLLRELSATTGETALLTRRSGDRVVCLERVESDAAQVRLSYERGTVQAVNAGASAWVLLAWEQPDVIARLLESTSLTKYTETTLTGPDEILQRLARVREDGFAVSWGELDPDAVGIAAPVHAADGSVAAGISIVTVQRRAEGVVDDLVSAVRRTAEQISVRFALSAE